MDKVDVTITGRITQQEKENLESQAEDFGFIHNGKGSIFRLIRAIARGDIILVRPAQSSRGTKVI